MTPGFSIYLDVVRLVAAMLVLTSHLAKFGFLPQDTPLTNLGHEAVIVFFVLSGSVIGHTALRPGVTLRDFAIARAARLYSVTVPALVLSYLLAYLLGDLAVEQRASWATPLLSLGFLNEAWFMWRNVPMNEPYWSLCYEAWYYVIFACLFFLRGNARWWAVALAAAVVGPRIIILLPIWWSGVWFTDVAARSSRARPLIGAALLVGSAAAIVIVNAAQLDMSVRDHLKHFLPQLWVLKASELFVTDYFNGILVLANFFGFKLLESVAAPVLLRCAPVIRWCAGGTFSIYLFHYPLLGAATRVVTIPHNAVGATFLALFIVLACFLLSYATERRKNVVASWLRRGLPRSRADIAMT